MPEPLFDPESDNPLEAAFARRRTEAVREREKREALYLEARRRAERAFQASRYPLPGGGR